MAGSKPLLDELQAHLAAVQQDPATPLDSHLLDRCKVLLPLSLDRQASDDLISSFVPALLELQQDPTPACQLLQRLVQEYSYPDILALAPSLDLALGLDLAARPYHELTLCILEKAASSISSAAQIALEPRILRGLIILLLVGEDMGVAEKAREALVKLLRVDQLGHDDTGAPTYSGGQGMVWKRVFGDQDVYKLFFTMTSWKSTKLELGRSRKTTAQIRLLQLVEDVAWMDWNVVSASHHGETETEFGSKGGSSWGRSLLDYAALHMIAWEDDDPLVLWNLINFLSGIASSGVDLPVTSLRPFFSSDTSDSLSLAPQLQFLVDAGLHRSTVSLYVSNDRPAFPGTTSLTNGYLYGPAASYLSTYASVYPTHLLQSEDLDRLQEHLYSKLDKTASSWARGESPAYDLGLLTSLPRTVLLPRRDRPWNTSLLSLLPSSHRNADLLNALGSIFSDRRRNFVPANAEDNSTLLKLRSLRIASEDLVPSKYTNVDQAAARMVYLLYLKNHPNLWSDIVAHADVIALKDIAVAALGVINALINSTWMLSTPLMIEADPTLLTEEDLQRLADPMNSGLPATGLEAILQQPVATVVIPYLLSPPKTFSNVSQHRGSTDTDNPAYQVAAAKMDTIRALENQLRKSDLSSQDRKIKWLTETLTRRIGEGVMGGGGIGREIATMEL